MNRRILIADDESTQIHLFQKIFSMRLHPDEPPPQDENSLFDVHIFRDGAPLVRFFQSESEAGRRIPLCILDVVMTTMDGLEAAEAVRAIDPEVFIIIITSHPNIAHDELMKSFKKDVYFMRKPLRTEELLAQVRSLLVSWNSQQELKKAYLEMDQTRRQFQTILDYSPTITIQQDLDGRYQMINRRFTEVFGLSREQTLGRTDAELFPSATASARARHIRKVITSGTQREFEEQIPVGGDMRTYLTVCYPISDVEDRMMGIGAMSADITKHKAAEKKVKEKETYLEAIMSTIQTGVMIIDPDSYKIIDANPWASQMLGYRGKELIGHDFYDFLSPDRNETEPSQRAISDEYVLYRDRETPLHVRRSTAQTEIRGRKYLVQSLLDITDIKHLMEKQEISIDLAKNLLNMINGGLPRHTPLAHGLVLFADAISVPCFKEGGDHCFVRNLDHNGARKTVISLKDQSGHEVGCMLRCIITDLIHHGILNRCPALPPEAIMSELNDSICRSDIFKPKDFFTSVMAEIDHHTLELRYVSNGHPRFFLIRGDEVTGLPGHGKIGRNPPIPLNPGTCYSSAVCQLQEGDKLIFYTDGLTDMPMANSKEMISSEELADIIRDMIQDNPAISVSAIMRGMLRIISERSEVEVIPFSTNTSDDDITILCLEIENRMGYHERILRPGDSEDLSRQILSLYQTILDEFADQGTEPPGLATRSVLAESILNAWNHGNGQDSDRAITVRWRCGNDFHLEVADEGDGFDCRQIPDPRSPENLTRLSGRGVYIIRRFADTVQWKDEGRRVALSMRVRPDPDAQSHVRQAERRIRLWQ